MSRPCRTAEPTWEGREIRWVAPQHVMSPTTCTTPCNWSHNESPTTRCPTTQRTLCWIKGLDRLRCKASAGHRTASTSRAALKWMMENYKAAFVNIDMHLQDFWACNLRASKIWQMYLHWCMHAQESLKHHHLQQTNPSVAAHRKPKSPTESEKLIGLAGRPQGV